MSESAVRLRTSAVQSFEPVQSPFGKPACIVRSRRARPVAAAFVVAAGLWLAPPAAAQDHVSAAVVYGAQTPDLTTLGPIDWAVWGWDMDGTSTSMIPSPRKKGATAISNFSWHNPSGGASLNGRAELATHLLTWSDGAPTAAAAGTTAGLRHREIGSDLVPGGGFSFQVPAVRATRKLTVFATAKDCTIRMTATVGSSSITRFLNGPVGTEAGFFEIHFHADAPGANLMVELAIDGPVSDCELAIHAVTLESPNEIKASTGLTLEHAITVAPSGSRITFAPELDGQTIVIHGEHIHTDSGAIEIDKNISIDASALRGGIKVTVLDRSGDPLLLSAIQIKESGNLTLDSVEFTGFARATLIQCSGQLHWTRGAITGSRTPFSGVPVILVGGSANLDRVTIAGNPGPAVVTGPSGQTTLSSCTITDNKSGVATSEGGTLTIRNSVVAGNKDGNNVTGQITEQGNNLFVEDSGLLPVGEYGGRVRTAPPKPGSPAATGGDSTVPGSPTSDARGVVPAVPGGIAIGACNLGAVVTSNADSGPGSLRDIIATAPPGSDIFVDLEGEINLLSTIPIANDVTIIGAQLNGQDTVRVMQVASGVDLTLVDCSVTGGRAARGGGIDILGNATLDMRNSTVSGNTATVSSGGGISASTGAIIHLSGVTIADNVCSGTSTSLAGAGLFTANNTRTLIRNSTFSGNRIDSGHTVPAGGGLSVRGVVTLINSTISGNEAPQAGGMHVTSISTVRIVNSTITDNTALVGGGGILVQGLLTIADSVVGGNFTTTNAPDIFLGTGTAAGLATEGANFISNNTSVETAFPPGPLAGTAASPRDPKLTVLAHWVPGSTACHLLLPGSPLVCAVQPTFDTDQTGIIRFRTSAIGAAEARPLSQLNLPDLNGNGIPDLLEFSYPGIGVGVGDLDGDGFSDIVEFTAMTDPTNGASFPRVTILKPQTEGGPWTIHGSSSPGVNYCIESSPDLGFGSPGVVVEWTAESLSFEQPWNPPPGFPTFFVRLLANP